MMRLPRPASPRALWQDFKAFTASRGPHHWLALTMALLIPVLIFIAFMFDTREAHERAPQIIYVESWRADRSIEETQANIRALEEQRKAAEKERQRQFQELENGMNRLGI